MKNQKTTILSALIFTSMFSYADDKSNIFLDNIDFENYEVQAEYGFVKTDISCELCEATDSIGGGISTNHNKNLFLNVLMRQDGSFKYREGLDNYDLDSFSLNSNLNYNFINKEDYNIYTGLGFSYLKNKTIGINSTEVYSSSKYSLSPVVTLGAMYDINNVVSLGLKYEHKFNVQGAEAFGLSDMEQDSLFLTLNVKIPQSKKIIKETTMVVIEKEMSIFFDINKASSLKLEKLDELLDAVERHKNKSYVIYINAHASKIGKEDYNKELSEKRAVFVQAEIIKKLIDRDPNISEKVIVRHYGFEHHSDNNDSSQRVDIHVSFF